jgi:hypothetical protein
VRDLYKIAQALTTEAYEGILHVDIGRGIRTIDPIIGNRAPAFFIQSINAHLNAAQMYAAKLFDRSGSAFTIPKFLIECRECRREFKQTKPDEVLAYITEAEHKIDGFRPVLKTIKHRRDQYLAHISRELVFDLKRLKEGPKLEFGQIRGVLFKGGRIVNELSRMLCGKTNPILDSDHDDYKIVVEMLRKQVAVELAQQEADDKRHGYHRKRPPGEPID